VSAVLDSLRVPVVAAPMAGGPSTPELVAAVAGAGGFGFLAAGYRDADAVGEEVAAMPSGVPFGVNVFVPGPPGDAEAVAGYVAGLADAAARQGVAVGEPHWDDDDWEAKIEMLVAAPAAVASFAFGCPDEETVARLHESGSEVWVTVTRSDEARLAVAAGADALVAQGFEAGAHQSRFELADDEEPLGLLTLLQLLRAETSLPLVASGGIATGAGIAAALAAGADAVQLGTAFLLCPEAGTSATHRAALREARPTRLTRAFTGRRARGLVNRFLVERMDAPAAYPEVHHATAPIRAAARANEDPEDLHLWAGQAYPLAREAPAAEIVADLISEARSALDAAGVKMSGYRVF
jgi:nitronate monooxygenase